MSKRDFLFKKWLVLTIFATIIGSVQYCYAWSMTGHRIVAEIAQRNLSKKAKKELFKLMGPQTLAEWSNWPDFIKSDSTWKHADPWHYINVPPTDNISVFSTYVNNFTGVNLYAKIEEMKGKVGNKALSAQERITALSFLVHLLGDLHQPLHVGRAEDLGGNRITVYWFNQKTNLHALWDESLIEYQKYSYTEYATILNNNSSKTAKKTIQQGQLMDWLFESNQLATQIYNGVTPEDKLGYRYNFLMVDILNRQLTNGGLRLAKVLNEILG